MCQVFRMTDFAGEEVPRALNRWLPCLDPIEGDTETAESLPIHGQEDDMADSRSVRVAKIHFSQSQVRWTMRVVWMDPHVLWSENQTQKASMVGLPASATEEVPDIPEPCMAFEDVRVNSREIRRRFRYHWMPWTSKSCFSRRAVLMKTVPHFLRGAFRNAMRIAMEEATHAQAGQHERGWKLFMLLPRMLLHRPPRGGNIPKNKLVSRFDDFSAGRWDV